MGLALFRCDASPIIGFGHVMRCLTIADHLNAKGWDISFYCEQGARASCSFLLNSPYDVFESKNMDAAVVKQHFSSTYNCTPDLVIVDGYHLDAEFESQFRSAATVVLVLDDMTNRPHDCDALLDQTFLRSAVDYKSLVPDTCEVLTGADYALLRSQFKDNRDLSLADRKERAGKGVKRFLVSLGGSDQSDLMMRILHGLDGMQAGYEVDIVLANAHQAEVLRRAIADFTHITCNLLHGVKDMAALLMRADLSIGAAGTTSWERCCLGLPCFVVVLEENQRLIAQNLTKAGAVLSLGHKGDFNSEAIISALKSFHISDLTDMIDKASRICDGQGVARLVAVLEAHLDKKKAS